MPTCLHVVAKLWRPQAYWAGRVASITPYMLVLTLLNGGWLSAARQLTVLTLIILGMVMNDDMGNGGQRGCVASVYTSPGYACD